MALRTRVWSAGKILFLGGALVVTYVLFAAASMRVALRARDDALDLQLDRPDAPGEAGERLRIPWGLAATGRVA